MKGKLKRYKLGAQHLTVPPAMTSQEIQAQTMGAASAGASSGQQLGAAIGTAFGPVGTIVGGAIGMLGGGVAGGIIGNQKAKKLQRNIQAQVDRANRVNDYIDYQNNAFGGREIMQQRRLSDVSQYMEEGGMVQNFDAAMMEEMMNPEMNPEANLLQPTMPGLPSNEQLVEVEKNELIFRQKGNSYQLVADFKNGKPHEKGGEPYVGQDGDIVIPAKYRKDVEKLIDKHGVITDNLRFNAIMSKLPMDGGTYLKLGGVIDPPPLRRNPYKLGLSNDDTASTRFKSPHTPAYNTANPLLPILTPTENLDQSTKIPNPYSGLRSELNSGLNKASRMYHRNPVSISAADAGITGTYPALNEMSIDYANDRRIEGRVPLTTRDFSSLPTFDVANLDETNKALLYENLRTLNDNDAINAYMEYLYPGDVDRQTALLTEFYNANATQPILATEEEIAQMTAPQEPLPLPPTSDTITPEGTVAKTSGRLRRSQRDPGAPITTTNYSTTQSTFADVPKGQKIASGAVSALGNLISLAPSFSNLAQSFRTPEVQETPYLRLERMKYADLSNPLRRLALQQERAQALQAQNLSGGSAQNLMAQQSQLAANRMNQMMDIDNREAIRQMEIENQNVGIENQERQLNYQQMLQDREATLQNFARRLDFLNAATEGFGKFGQKISMDAQTALKDKKMDLVQREQFGRMEALNQKAIEQRRENDTFLLLTAMIANPDAAKYLATDPMFEKMLLKRGISVEGFKNMPVNIQQQVVADMRSELTPTAITTPTEEEEEE